MIPFFPNVSPSPHYLLCWPAFYLVNNVDGDGGGVGGGDSLCVCSFNTHDNRLDKMQNIER